MDAAGGFVVVWESFVSAGSNSSLSSIQARLYGNDASGTSVQARRLSLDKLVLDDFETGNTASWSDRTP